MLLTSEQIEALRRKLGIRGDDGWPDFASDSPEGTICREVANRLNEPDVPVCPVVDVPARVDLSMPDQVSTQDAFGRLLVRLGDIPDVAQYVMTTSPDVSVSTNLGDG